MCFIYRQYQCKNQATEKVEKNPDVNAIPIRKNITCEAKIQWCVYDVNSEKKIRQKTNESEREKEIENNRSQHTTKTLKMIQYIHNFV